MKRGKHYICINGDDDFEIVGRLGSIPKKLLLTMWDSDVVGIYTDDEETLIVVLKGNDDDESLEG